MIEGDKTFGYDLVCDDCGEIVDDFEEFMDAVEYKKQNGWKSRKTDDGSWEDLCPSCARKFYSRG